LDLAEIKKTVVRKYSWK